MKKEILNSAEVAVSTTTEVMSPAVENQELPLGPVAQILVNLVNGSQVTVTVPEDRVNEIAASMGKHGFNYREPGNELEVTFYPVTAILNIQYTEIPLKYAL